MWSESRAAGLKQGKAAERFQGVGHGHISAPCPLSEAHGGSPLTSMHLPDASAPCAPPHSRQRLGSAESHRTQLLMEHLVQPPPKATKPSLHSAH